MRLKKNIKKKVFYDQKNNEKQHYKKKQSHNAITNVFFNNNNQFKYDLTSYTCQQNHNVMTFDNSIELQNHVLNYHKINTRSIESKYYTREINYI